jgi:hypothetical protein
VNKVFGLARPYWASKNIIFVEHVVKNEKDNQLLLDKRD